MNQSTVPYTPPTVFVFALLGLLASGALLMSACDSSSDDGSELTGTYSLVAMEIEGEDIAIPTEVSGGQLTLDGDGSWSGFFVLEVESDDFPQTVRGQGTYAEDDDTTRFFVESTNYEDPELEDISQTTGRLVNGRLSIEMEKIGDDFDNGHSAVVEKD